MGGGPVSSFRKYEHNALNVTDGLAGGKTVLLRLHFTEEDLARVELAPRADPLWETTLGFQQLITPVTAPGVFRAAQRRVRSVVHKHHLRGAVRLLSAIVPESGYYPDFLTPQVAADDLSAGLEAIRATPADRIRQDVLRLADDTPPPPELLPWLRDLARGDRDRMAELTGALHTVHDVLATSSSAQAESAVEADHGRRAQARSAGGVHGLLGSLAPMARWLPPVLYINCPVDRDVHLAGRGLRLIPSYYCSRMPVALAAGDLTPVLVYPVDHELPAQDVPDALRNLLGRTRANVLAAVRYTATTGEVARRLGVSPASASEHVHVLAAANLVRSQRAGGQVLHTLTPVGAVLLGARIPANTISTWGFREAPKTVELFGG